MIRHKVFYGPDEDGGWSPYMEKWGLGNLWVHKFMRGDVDPDPHDHPWAFWTFPLVSYVEEVTGFPNGGPFGPLVERQIVTAFQWHHRPADYLHRVLGKAKPEVFDERFADGLAGTWTGSHEAEPCAGTIWTIVWHGKASRRWGFLKTRDGRWCWQDWEAYVNEGGRSAPCE